jgi:hypothetical protein
VNETTPEPALKIPSGVKAEPFSSDYQIPAS